MRKRDRLTEPSKRSSGGGFLSRQLPGKASSPRRILFSAAMLLGAGLLVATSAVHSNLWSESYRAIPTIGNLFLAQVFAGVLLALGVIFYRRPLLAFAGIGYMAATIAGLLVSVEYGLFGFQDSLDAPFAQLTLNLEVAGIVAFAAALAVAVNASLAAGSNQVTPAHEPLSPEQPPMSEPVWEVSVPPLEEVSVAAAAPAPERLVWRPATVFAAEESLQESPQPVPAEPVPAEPVTAEAAGTPVEVPATLVAQPLLAGSAVAARLGGQFEQSERAVMERERVLGLDHPATLTSLVNLAYMYRSAGRIEEALAVQERVAVDTPRIHGQKHPYTLTSQVNLAQLQGRMRKSVGKASRRSGSKKPAPAR